MNQHKTHTSAFMDLSSPPVSHGYTTYNPVSPNFYPMSYYQHQRAPDYGLHCNTRNSFMPAMLNHHPLTHHPYLTAAPTPLQTYPTTHDLLHEGT